MKIFICASKYNYGYVSDIKKKLEDLGHIITVPNSYDEPMKEEEIKKLGIEEHSKWKNSMIRLQKEKVDANDCILVLNFQKNDQPNYIGGATFLEMFRAFDSGKKVYLHNPIPDNILRDEIIGMNPIIINGDLDLIN